MIEPADPVLIFDQDGRLFVLHEPAVADELIDSVDEFVEGYDGRGRPVRAYGEPGQVRLAVVAMETQSEELRARVDRYYSIFAARHPTRTPPRQADLAAFIRAVADNWIEE
ncbi:hypothetical protein ACFTZ8_01290 [Streptomyces fungicidicus]|uniref:hypothetical protein n=1 Tax=Streptomyces fungicidicus TaxID=68203 RepID=UPI0036368B1B